MTACQGRSRRLHCIASASHEALPGNGQVTLIAGDPVKTKNRCHNMPQHLLQPQVLYTFPVAKHCTVPVHDDAMQKCSYATAINVLVIQTSTFILEITGKEISLLKN